MNNNCPQWFSKLEFASSDAALCDRILKSIVQIQRRRNRMRRVLCGSLLILSIVALVLALQYSSQAFVISGFGQYVSLIFSDGKIVLASWRVFALSLLETFPIGAFAFIVGSVLVFLFSLRKITQTVNTQSFKIRTIG